MTFKEYYDSLSDTTPKTAFVREIAEATMKSENTVRQYLCYGRIPDRLTQSVIAKRLGIPAEALFPAES